jgi:hypothetical protein
VKRRWVFVGCALVTALLLSAVAASAATSLFGTRFNVGETVQFRIEDSTTWWWGCCSCTESLVLSWRITDVSGVPLYSVVHDAPVPSSSWLGTWSQTRLDGTPVPVGQYILYVDTSAGTMSRCFSIYDRCSCCNPCTSCVCEHVTSITSCACRTSLVFVDTCTNCLPFFGVFGCFSSPCCSGCSP